MVVITLCALFEYFPLCSLRFSVLFRPLAVDAGAFMSAG